MKWTCFYRLPPLLIFFIEIFWIISWIFNVLNFFIKLIRFIICFQKQIENRFKNLMKNLILESYQTSTHLRNQKVCQATNQHKGTIRRVQNNATNRTHALRTGASPQPEDQKSHQTSHTCWIKHNKKILLSHPVLGFCKDCLFY